MAASSDAKGIIQKRIIQATPYSLNQGLNVLKQMIKDLSDGEKITGIGVAIGGPLDWKEGIVSPLHQLEWRNVPLRDILQKEWDCPFSVDVDTNVAALGEYVLGGETASRFLYITVSTGVGGGYLIDGKIYRGARGGHPEIGHQSIHYRCSNPSEIFCECGATDCLEAFVSGNGIQRIYKKSPEELNDNEWEEVTFNLGQGVRNATIIYLPDVVVLGGGVALGRGEKLIAGIRNILERNLHLVPVPHVRISRFGYDTALLGALLIARQGIE